MVLSVPPNGQAADLTTNSGFYRGLAALYGQIRVMQTADVSTGCPRGASYAS